MPTGQIVFLSAACSVLAIIALVMVWSFGRESVALDCKRDGAVWLAGKKYECHAVER